MDDTLRWLLLRAPSHGGGAIDSPFRAATDLFTPRLGPHFYKGRSEKVCVMAFDHGLGRRSASDFELTTQILDGKGDPVRLGPVRLKGGAAEGDGFRRFLLDLTPEELAVGDYLLKVTLRDTISGTIGEASQSVSVE